MSEDEYVELAEALKKVMMDYTDEQTAERLSWNCAAQVDEAQREDARSDWGEPYKDEDR